MKHAITASAYGFRLRPVELSDAAFIISLRSDPVHSRFLNATSPSLPDQHAYLEKLFQRPGDYSFVLEHEATGRAEGLAAIWDVGAGAAPAEWGRWILRPGSLAAPVHVHLVYSVAFERLNVASLYCRTVLANTTVVAFHDHYGLRRGKTLPAYFQRHGESFDSIEHWLDREQWPALKQRHTPLLERIGARLARG